VKTRTIRGIQTGSAALAAVLVGLGTAGCTAKETKPADAGTAASVVITVDATDTECALSATTAATGASTFVITNNGTKATEFYVYGEGGRVLAEVENVSPGLERKLVVQFSRPGTYQTACKPGMVGDGIRADFTVSGDALATNTGGKLKDAAEEYQRYVDSQADALVPAVESFVAAIKAGDIESAKAQYPTSRVPYERIEPVAESFPDNLDPRIDLREADLEPGQRWTGFHRLEKDLWVSGLQPDTNAVADQLLADVKELKDGISTPGYTIEPLQIAGGAQALLDEVATSKITGEEDIFSHTDLWDFNANLEGSRAAVAAVRPILEERDHELGERVDERFDAVEALLNKLRAGDGFVLYTTVTESQRQELSRAIDALGKEVSQVQGVIAAQ